MIRILTDSTSDILPQEAGQRGITVVPLRVNFGQESVRDNVDITHQEFYERLAAAQELPTTSQPTPEDFLPHFEKAREDGDTVICIMLAGSLSGTVQSALIAKDICGYENIYVVDSTQTVIGLRALVDLAMLLAQQGKSAAEIVSELEQARARVRLYAMVDTLEYLHKGGRLSAAVKVVGTLLKVKPLITLKDGALSVVGKAMGVKEGQKALLKLTGEELNNDPRLPVYFGYTCKEAACGQLRALAEEKYGLTHTQTHSVGAVIGTHVGPGATVIAYLEKN